MDVDRELGRQILALLEGIDLAEPRVDEDEAADRLRAYVSALGLPAPEVRWVSDLRALRDARVWGRDRANWPSFATRQWNLLDRLWPEHRSADDSERAALLARSDRTVLDAGLGWSDAVWTVRHVTRGLHQRARQLAWGTAPLAPRRVASLVPLAEAAAGLFAFGVGAGRDLVAVSRPRLRLDPEGRVHDWDGRPAADWPDGRGLYFWRGVHMTESAGRWPEKVTSLRVARWENAERRRVAIERMGPERFVTGLGAWVVQEDDYGRLWRSERKVGGEPFVAVEVVNATEEADGSRRRYLLRVPPDTRSARRAVAWTFGLAKSEYSVVVET